MKICFLSAASSIHTIRWVNAMASLGHNVTLVTMHPVDIDKLDHKVELYQLKITNKLGYYLNLLEAKKVIRKINPDILNVHYASGYGTLARFINFKPTLLSVWGSDVFLFPFEKTRNKKLLIKNLKAANMLTSTSVVMKKQTELFINPSFPIKVIPFGIDLNSFKPLEKENSDYFVIGTVKSLEQIYGVDILINAVAKLIQRLREEGSLNLANNIRLEIVGDGSQLSPLNKLAADLNISKITKFIGSVPNEEVPKYLNNFHIYCALSRSESFGVAVLEASACEIPVIVSNVGGLPEVVIDGETGFVSEFQNINKIVDYLYELLINEEKRKAMGRKGRIFVSEHYDWNKNVSEMEKTYKQLIDMNKGIVKN